MLSSESPRSRARARTQTESTKPENVRVVDANPSKSLLRMISQNDVNEISLTDSNLTSAFCIENSAKDVQRTAHRSAANDAQNMLDQAVQYGVQLTERVRQLTETVHNLEHDLDSHRTELKLIHEKYSDQQQQFDNEIRTLRHYEYSFATAQQQLHEMQKDLMNERERYKTLESTYHQMLLKTHGNQGSSVLENTDRDDTNLLFERWMSFTKLKLLEKSQQMMNNKSESVLKNLTLELQREKENSTFIKKMLKEMEEQTKLLQSQINASNTSDKQVEHFQFIQQTNEHLREEVRRMQSVLSTEQERGNRQIKLINDLNDKLNIRGEESTSTAKSSQNSAPENPAKDIELEHIQEKCSRIEKLMVGLEQALRIERARTETQARTIIALRNNLDSRAPTNRVGPTLNRYASNLPTRSNLQNFFNRAEGSSSPRSFASFRVTRPRESVEPAPIILDQIPLIKQDSIVNSDSHSTIETLSP